MHFLSKYPVQKCVFYKHYVIYVSAYKGNAYTVAYDRTGLTDEQAKYQFISQHETNLDEMVQANDERNNKSKIILN